MIWFTLDGNYGEVQRGRYMLVYYASQPHVQRIANSYSQGSHPTVNCDKELREGELVSFGKDDPHTWNSSVAVADTLEDAERLLDHAQSCGNIYMQELENARLKMLASIRLICD